MQDQQSGKDTDDETGKNAKEWATLYEPALFSVLEPLREHLVRHDLAVDERETPAPVWAQKRGILVNIIVVVDPAS